MELWVSLGVVLASSFQFKDEETENIDFAITECIYIFLSHMCEIITFS